MRVVTLERIADIPAAAWNAVCHDGYPFLRHEFLSALERSGSVGGDSGWQPCHQLVYRQAGTQHRATDQCPRSLHERAPSERVIAHPVPLVAGQRTVTQRRDCRSNQFAYPRG